MQVSMVATAAKSAQLPHCCWSLTEVTPPWSTQLQEEGASFLAILAVIFSSFMSGWTAWSAGRAPPGAEMRLIQF